MEGARLSDEGKEEVALMIVLWKEFKSQGKLDIEISRQALEFVAHFGVRVQ